MSENEEYLKAKKIVENYEKQKQSLKKPVQLEDNQIDLKPLRKICQSHINFIDDDEDYHEDNDNDHYVYEIAMETIFGKDVFEFINKRRN
jgi:hypothetical protein